MTRAWQGVVFHTAGVARRSTTTPPAGPSVTVDVPDRVCETGRQVAADFTRTMRIASDEYLPPWNCRAIPAARCEPGS